MQRVVGDYFMDVQDSAERSSILCGLALGSAVVLGALLFIYSLLVVRKREIIEPGPTVSAPGE